MIDYTQLFKRGFLSVSKDAKNENEYNPTPRVQSTVRTQENASYNDVFENVREELNKKYKNEE